MRELLQREAAHHAEMAAVKGELTRVKSTLLRDQRSAKSDAAEERWRCPEGGRGKQKLA